MVILGRHMISRSPFKDLDSNIVVTDKYEKWQANEAVIYSTYQSFKGMESDIVYLVEVVDPCDKFPESLYINGLGRSRWKSIVLKMKI
jgi:superfamily I DNA/RNA helicase